MTNNNPFYYAEVWHNTPNTLVGNILDLPTYTQYLKSGAKLWSFTGRKATVCIVTTDILVTRLEALDFATMFMRGTYVTVTVDLKNLTSTTTNGSPPP
jgi:hypothetical protein